MTCLPKVNASMLPQHVGKLVCLVGKITQVGPTGDSLKLLASDQQTVNISLRDKYEERPGDCVQIIGTVKKNLTVEADKYISFAGPDFDLELYNKLITKYLPRFSDLFELKSYATTNNDHNMSEWD